MDLSRLLSFDPAILQSTASETQPLPPAVASQLRHVKELLSVPIDVLVRDSEDVRRIIEEIKPQLPSTLRDKLRPTGFLPFLEGKVLAARDRIEARRNYPALKADIAQRCQLLNEHKAALDAKSDTSALVRKLKLLEKDLADFEAKVRATKQLIQDTKALMANSQREAENLTIQMKAEFAELNTLRQRLVTGENEADEAVIAEADGVRIEAMRAIEEFLPTSAM